MLEHTTLLLWPPDAASLQAVADPTTGAPLGFARPQPPGAWRRWFAGPILEVHEHEDASLLCVIRCGWLWPDRRLVYDADGLRVGAVRGRRLNDPYGRVVAVRRPDAAPGCDIFLDPEGQALATLRPGQHGVQLAFTKAIAADPFAKMLVLAAALHG